MRATTAILKARNWLNNRIAWDHPSPSRKRIIVICTAIVLAALSVRVFHWQDRHVEITSGKTSLGGVFNRYQKEARRMLDEGAVLYPRERPANGDARMLVHPPGYSVLLAGIYKTGIDQNKALWFVQTKCDAAAAVLIFLIGLELFHIWIATEAARLAAFSPPLAYYSLILSPDTLAILPLLVAVYIFVRAYRRPRLTTIIAVGVLLGLSCWLRANALLLAPFLSLITIALFPRGKRLTYSFALSGAALIVISPITIRNMIVFGRFIPVSIAAGENLVVGIGDYDKQGTLGMPRSDRETRFKDAEWNNRPDYAPSLWTPDGIARDQKRFAVGLKVIRAHPAWFLGVMIRRAGFMLSYNDSRRHDWPMVSAIVPPVFAEPGFGQPIVTQSATSPSAAVLVLNGEVISQSSVVAEDQPALWSASPVQLLEGGTVLAQGGTAAMTSDGLSVQISGDASEYGDQFASESIPVRSNFDYVLSLPVELVKGDAAIKVTSADRRISLAAAIIPKDRPGDQGDARPDEETESLDGSSPTEHMREIQLPFATGNRSELRIVVSNNGSAAQPIVQIGEARLFEIGATPYGLTRYARYVVRAVQRNIFTTSRMVPVVLVGLMILVLAGHWRSLAILVAVPVYYLCAQSPLSTEYRYILAIHYFLFMGAAVTFYSAVLIIRRGFVWARKFGRSKEETDCESA